MQSNILACLLLSLSTSYAQQSAQTLADVLAEKGMINAAERARVRDAAPGDAVRMLTALLQSKGVLTATEAARIGPDAVPMASPPPAPKAEAPAVTAASHAPVVIYGTALLNTFYNTSLNNIQDVPLFAGKQGTDPTGGDKNFGMTARQTRLGLRYTGPKLASARLSGQVEIDMFGGNATFPNSVGFDVPRLRLAYGRADWKTFSLVAGQDYSVFAPLNPTSFAGYSIPDMAASGNLWIRSPQIRAEWHKEKLLFQIAAADPNVGDYPSTFSTVRVAGIGERGRFPGVDSRASYTSGPLALGLSGHYSHGKNAGAVGTANFQTEVNSWGIAGDYSIPLTSVFILTGEAYTGRALGIFSSALGESVTAVRTPGQHGVSSRGGWIQLQANWTKRWQNNAAYGIDAINAHELPVGARDKTQTYMGNLVYKWSPSVSLAWEWKRFLTNYLNQRGFDEKGDHVNMAVAFTF